MNEQFEQLLRTREKESAESDEKKLLRSACEMGKAAGREEGRADEKAKARAVVRKLLFWVKCDEESMNCGECDSSGNGCIMIHDIQAAQQYARGKT